MADALCKAGSNRSEVRAVCLAVSGVNHSTDQQRILNWLRFVSLNFDHLSLLIILVFIQSVWIYVCVLQRYIS